MPQSSSSSRPSKFVDSYKRKPAGVDNRTVRGLRRSLDWKQSRSAVVGQRRNIMDAHELSPVTESHPDDKPDSQKLVAGSSKADSRREMLQKWKKEKELMKKMDLAQQAKKKPFRVVHVDTEVFPFQKFTQPSKTEAKSLNVTRKAEASVASAALESNVSKAAGKPPVMDRKLRSGRQTGASSSNPAKSCLPPAAAVSKQLVDAKKMAVDRKPAPSRLQSASHASRLASDANQRTTRSQSRTLAEKHPVAAAKTSSALKGNTYNSTRAAADRSTGAERALSEKHISSKQTRSRTNSSKSDTAACEVEASRNEDGIKIGKVRRNAVAAASSSAEKTPRQSGRKSRRTTKTVVTSCMVTEDQELAGADADIEDMEMSDDDNDRQSRRSRNSVAVPPDSLQKSSRRSGYKNTENIEQSESGAGENVISVSDFTCDRTAVSSDDVASAVSGEKIRAGDILPDQLVPGDDSVGTVDVDKGRILQAHATDECIGHSANAEYESSTPEVVQSFRTPGRSMRPRSMLSPSLTFASVRKTPKNLCNSLLLRRMSPEEGVELLKRSPMIEINRRRSVRPPESDADSMPTFDDLDKILNASGIAADALTINSMADSSDVCNNVIDCDKNTPHSKVDVSYFRNLIQKETDRLTMLCVIWRSTVEDLPDLADEARGCIRTTIGQAELLMAERFKQFAGLVSNCEFRTGEKEVTCTDLQGFWDMVYFQVEDVYRKFSELDKLKAADWVVARQTPVKPKPTKKKKKKIAVVAAPAARAVATTGQQSNFAEFRRQMKLKQKTAAAVVAAATDDNMTAMVNASLCQGVSQSPVPKSPARRSTTPRSPARRSMSGSCTPASEAKESLMKNVLRRSVRASMSMDRPRHEATPSAAVTSVSIDDAVRQPLRSILHNSGDTGVSTSDTGGSRHIQDTCSDGRKKTDRKSVCFVKDRTPINLTEGGFLKYIEPTELSGSGDVTPVTESQSQLNTSSHSTPHGVLKTATQRSGRRSTLETRSKTTPPSGACTTTTLVDISGDNVDDDDDDVTVTKFGRLKVGFTPGVDGKSRRISGFSPPVRNGTPVSVMSALDEENVDLIKFSPSVSLESAGRRSLARARRQTLRRSRRVTSFASSLED